MADEIQSIHFCLVWCVFAHVYFVQISAILCRAWGWCGNPWTRWDVWGNAPLFPSSASSSPSSSSWTFTLKMATCWLVNCSTYAHLQKCFYRALDTLCLYFFWMSSWCTLDHISRRASCLMCSCSFVRETYLNVNEVDTLRSSLWFIIYSWCQQLLLISVYYQCLFFKILRWFGGFFSSLPAGV